MLDPRYGYIHSCPANLGTGMRASVHVTLPGWHKKGKILCWTHDTVTFIRAPQTLVLV